MSYFRVFYFVLYFFECDENRSRNALENLRGIVWWSQGWSPKNGREIFFVYFWINFKFKLRSPHSNFILTGSPGQEANRLESGDWKIRRWQWHRRVHDFDTGFLVSNKLVFKSSKKAVKSEEKSDENQHSNQPTLLNKFLPIVRKRWVKTRDLSHKFLHDYLEFTLCDVLEGFIVRFLLGKIQMTSQFT